MAMEKKELRRFFAEKRKSIPAEQRQSFDRAIRQNLRELPLFSQSTCVAAFCPLGAEPDLLPVLGEKRLFLPRFAEEQQAYELVEVTDLQKDLVTGRYKIAEPRPELEKADWDFVRAEVLFLVPAVAYDRRGVRLGRGGGFYDRMLCAVAKPPVGVVYSCQIGEGLPLCSHDVPVGWVVTESEVINCLMERQALSGQGEDDGWRNRE